MITDSAMKELNINLKYNKGNSATGQKPSNFTYRNPGVKKDS